jgi:hypothetical protein
MSWTGGSIQHTSRQKNRTVTKDINIYIYIYIYIYKKKKKKKKKSPSTHPPFITLL